MAGGLVARRVSYLSMPELEPIGFIPKVARKLCCLFIEFCDKASLMLEVYLATLNSSGLAGLVPKRVGLKVVADVQARLLTMSEERSKLGFVLIVLCLRPFFVELADLGSLRFTKLS